MLARVPVLLVLFALCPKNIWTQKNNDVIASGSPKSSTTVHTKRNVVHESTNQMSLNQGMKIDLQQRLNSWRAANPQAQRSLQGYNQQPASLQQQSSRNTQDNNLQNAMPPNAKQALQAIPSSLSPSHQAQNFQNIQVDLNNINKENVADSQLQIAANTNTANVPNIQQVLQLLQSLQQQQSQNLNVQNVQVQSQQHNQKPDVSPPAELQHISGQQQKPKTLTTQDRPVKPNLETNSHANLHSVNIPEVEQPQNQHFLLPSSPAQIIDRSQLQNLLQYSPHLTQTLDLTQNSIPAHQISTLNAMPPSTGFHSNQQTYSQHQIYPTYPTTLATTNPALMKNMYETQGGISRIGSSDSHIRSLLPIIYSLLRDSNDCGCCNHRCDCSQMRRNQQLKAHQELESRSGGKSKDKQNEGKHESKRLRKVSNKAEKEANTNESQENRDMKCDKHPNEKFDKSYEDYYSEEDYDDESNYID